MAKSISKANPYRLFLTYSVASRAFMVLVFTVNMIYFVTVAGLDPLQMVLVGTTLELSVFIFEIPTGVVADSISRRFSVILGVFLIGSGFVVQAVFVQFGMILLAQVLWGVGYTFTSGALQAWISDEIGEEKAANAFLHAAQVEQLGALAATGLSVSLAIWSGMRLPMLLGGVLFWVLGFYLMARMPEHGYEAAAIEKRDTWKAMRQTLGSGMHLVRGRPLLLRILLVGFFYGLYSEGLDRLWVPHVLDRFQLPTQGEAVMVGWVGALNAIGMSLTFVSAGVLRHWFGEQVPQGRIPRWLTVFSVLLVGSLVAFALAGNIWFSFGLLLLTGVLRDLINPLYMAWVNQRLDSSVRATIISMSSLVDAFGQIGGGPLVGMIARQFTIQAGLLSSAALLSPVILLLLLTANNHPSKDHSR
ncbi:MAG: MFS transporter [Chloroflexi bacterium HGW-Chloroflexi-10]|nr:MAG: MFS transporter [Chloroflexi bacterium HGW-Chloroflexi-10]